MIGLTNSQGAQGFFIFLGAISCAKGLFGRGVLEKSKFSIFLDLALSVQKTVLEIVVF